MFAKRGGQIPKHRIGIAGNGHQIRRCASIDDALRDPTQLPGRNPHVKRRADVEPHGQPMQLCHHHVFKTRSLQLPGVSEHFGTDEAGNIVDDHPSARRLLPYVACQTIRARLERDHVDAFGGPVGHFRTLAGLEIEAVEVARQLDHTIHIEAHHARERSGRSSQALKTDIHPRVLSRIVLLDNVGEHAVAGRKLEASYDLLEKLLEANNRVEVVGGWIEADDYVAATISESFEY